MIFKKFKIKDIGKVVSGGTPSTKNNEYWNGAVGWITPKDLSSNEEIYVSNGERNITRKGLEESSAKLLPKNTILMTSRAPIGYIAISKNSISTNQGFKSVICDENICNYLYFFYWLKNNMNLIKNNANGSTFQEISASVFKNLDIELPSLEIQKKISKILYIIDMKIQINKKINKNLEQQLQVIFKKMFLDFEMNIDYNPDGWYYTSISNLIERNREKIKDFDDWKSELLIDLSNMPRFSIAIDQFDLGEKFKSNIYKLNKYDLLFGSIRPYFGKAGFSPINGVVTGTILSFKPKNFKYYSLLLCLISSKRFIAYTVANSKGTKMPTINWEDFGKYEIALPKEEIIIKKFNEIVNPLISEISNNIHENLKLRNIRDILLPKLMSGEIDVSSVKI